MPSKTLSRCMLPTVVLSLSASGWTMIAAARSASPANASDYQVLEPIELGNITLYPIVRAHSPENAEHWQYLTLDQGLKSGKVVITEAGKAAGLLRSRADRQVFDGDEVNTLVLLNKSDRPLLLLAGEIVTGGKQDRIIAKDRIVPAHSLPLDLSVFCIEPHRWIENSPKFGAAGDIGRNSFMVEPSVRRQAMAAQSQQQVWNAVDQSIAAASPLPAQVVDPHLSGQSQPMYELPATAYSRGGSTSSYARAMAAPQVQNKVDAVAAPALGEDSEMPEKLQKQQVIGIVAAIDGHILWADLFATSDLLNAYWSKLVRSYAAESINHRNHDGPQAGKEAALRFITDIPNGHETSDGVTNVYRYREIHGSDNSVFILESLLPDTGFEVHRTKLVQTSEVVPIMDRSPVIR